MNKTHKKTDKYLLTQKPNLPIIVWAIASIGAKLFDGTGREFFELVAFGAIFTWAWLEIFQGVNNFRRVLGLAVIAFTIYNKLS